MQRVRCATRGIPPADGASKESQAALEASVEQAFGQVRPLGQKLLAKHEQWQQDNGS
ncbi:GL19766 [Drosophila persimilis]|uniref:GL19766 n=2 Tax=pseudoobscura subgroup TaxID=32358 RepID=B4GYP0_DROPE|nr:GL19766 [Drosophila persimilis]